MLLVYAMTRAVDIGWGTAETFGLLVGSVALIPSFVVIQLRSKAPLLPMRIFRLRTLTGANVTSFLLGTSLFSQFFLAPSTCSRSCTTRQSRPASPTCP